MIEKITKTKSNFLTNFGKLFLLAVVIFSLQQTSFAQTEDKPWSIGLYGGKSEYNGDLGSGFFNFNKAFYGFGGMSFARYINKSFDLSLYGSYGDHGLYENKDSRFLSRNTNIDLTLKYKFIQNDDAKFVPYVFAGIGTRFLNAPTESFNLIKYDERPDLVLPVGAGVDYRINDVIALRYFFTYGWTNHDYHDGQVNTKFNDYQLQHNLGIVFSFGKMKDADNDGISDKKDKCPNTPANVQVDKNGCPIDSDGDGIPDYQDDCPNIKGVASAKGCPDKDGDGVADDKDNCPDTKGLVELNGCPDADGDGIPDHLDECPDIKGLAQFKGCPDTDGDGIPDHLDKCPKEKGLAEFNGCPDTDGDGIPDPLDKCPNLKGPAHFDGCPDSDGDGIPDHLDRCPDIKGIPENKGCPEITKKEKQLFEKVMQGIQFEVGKAVIKTNSFAILNDVVATLNSHPEWTVEVQGHTDNTGSYDLNKSLSQERADAVKKYLEDKGVKNKLTAKGYGPDQPKADNNTAAGRTQNRRVEFKITYEE